MQTDKPALDEGEDLGVESVPLADVRHLIDSGEINHAVHVAALLLALDRGFLSPPMLEPNPGTKPV